MYEERLAGAIKVTMKPQKVEEEIDFEEFVDITANDLSLDDIIEVNEEYEVVREESDLENHNDQENQEVNVVASNPTAKPLNVY
jgi:hypothetical protein